MLTSSIVAMLGCRNIRSAVYLLKYTWKASKCVCVFFFSRSYLLIAADGKCKNADNTNDGEEGPSRHQQGVNGNADNVVHGKDEKDALHT